MTAASTEAATAAGMADAHDSKKCGKQPLRTSVPDAPRGIEAVSAQPPTPSAATGAYQVRTGDVQGAGVWRYQLGAC
jgi:hypothetical protein